MAVLLKVDAVSDDGGGSGLEVEFSLGNGTILATPFETVLNHPEHLQLEFPDTIDSGVRPARREVRRRRGGTWPTATATASMIRYAWGLATTP